MWTHSDAMPTGTNRKEEEAMWVLRISGCASLCRVRHEVLSMESRHQQNNATVQRHCLYVELKASRPYQPGEQSLSAVPIIEAEVKGVNSGCSALGRVTQG